MTAAGLHPRVRIARTPSLEAGHAAGRAAVDRSVEDVMLPEQFFERLGSQSQRSGERRLIFTVLLDGVQQYWRDGDDAWFCSPIEWEPFGYTFLYICAMLNLEPDYLLRGIRQTSDRPQRRGSSVAQPGGRKKKVTAPRSV